MTGVNNSINAAAYQFHYYKLADYYNQTSDLAKLGNITAPFGSSDWNTTAQPILDNMRHYIQYFIFVNFQAEGPKEIEETSDAGRKVDLYNESFEVVFEYFYIGAGGFLIMLAVMYLFGKIHLRKDEWVSVVIRFAIGIGLPFVSIIGFLETPGDTTGFRYQQPYWLIPIVTFGFAGVLTFDNLSKIAFNVTRRHRRHSAASTLADVETGRNQKVEMHAQNQKQVQFDNRMEHSRTVSEDSDITLGGEHTQPGNGNRGYAHLVQEDDEHEYHGKPGQR